MTGEAGTVDPRVQRTARWQAGETGKTGLWDPGLDRHTVLAGILVFAGYFLGARIGFALTFQPHPVSVMWPANAILMAALLLTPTRTWWFQVLCVLPAHLLVELQSGVPFRMVLCWFLSNSSEALIGAASTRWVMGSTRRFDQTRGMGALLLCGGLLAPTLSTFLDSAFVWLNGFGHQGYWDVWRMRLGSNVFTDLTLVPAIVTWSAFRLIPPGFSRGRFLVEASVFFVGLLTVSLMVFYWQNAGPARTPALLYTPIPLLLWAAVRLGPTTTSTATFGVALLSIWSAVHGRGPFTSESPEKNALTIQVFFLMVSTTFMFLAMSSSERRKAEERLAKAFHSSPDAMLISQREDGRIIEVNERWEQMFGHERGETIGRTVSELNIYGSGTGRERLIDGTLDGESVHDLELCLQAKTGKLRHVQISASAEEIGGKNCLITVVRDIEDRKRAEEAQKNLAHVSRLALIGEMTALVAHEVNQPLGAILSNAEAAELLLKSTRPNLEEIKQILADIRKDDLRADETIRRIRALLTKHECQVRPLNLNETIADVLLLVAGDAKRRRVQIIEELEPVLPLVLGDRFQLQQVLLNLIVNGMDAMNETPEARRVLKLKARADEGDAVRVTVTDWGHGVTPEQKERIFDSFFTTKEGGMGLGLWMARSIVEAHRGRLWLESNSERGATFHFTVQKAGGQPPARRPKGAELIGKTP
jgi:two-component system sensor kinase FixL